MKIFKYISLWMAGLGIVVIALIAWLVFTPKGHSSQSKAIQIDSHSGQAAGGDSSSVDGNDPSATIPEYDYNEALDHIGEKATVKGTVIKVFTSKGGVTFFDYCKSSTNCPFSAVIFASDLDKFGDVSKYERELAITGMIRSYQSKAEIVINDPAQIE